MTEAEKPGAANALAGAMSYGVGQAIAAASAGTTGGASHKYNGEIVASSARAKKIGGGFAAVLAGAIPVFGSLVGTVVGRAIASVVDRARDEANAITAEAQKQ